MSTYYSLQGRVMLADRLLTGRPGALAWAGDAPDLTLKFSQDKDEISENYTGNRGTASSMRKALKATFELSLRYFDAKTLALALAGTVIDVPAGTVTAEKLPPALAGDTFMLDHRDLSTLALTDSTDAQPKPLVLNQDYVIDSPEASLVKILKVDGFKQPFLGNYAYGASTNVAAFTIPSIEKYGVFDGINTIDNSRMRAQMYRMQFDPVSDIGLIQDSHGLLKLSGSLLLDVVNASKAEYGGYWRAELPKVA
ncbi:MAG: hypothetical protein GAK28_00692 [Luteibacter sp.]|uniref:phage tail tube protein n=1 Tax=Luteibacter sp. TaxID=1886636 RepID=UPI0013819DE2|nr:hypothetical protein [Luteibacter sp.]KAF1009059.1 MAG: hypothetical protein GAK28_00692 [Luteibacter sp.]